MRGWTFLGLMVLASPAVAQQVIVAGSAPMVVGQQQGTMLLAGTEVPLRVRDELTTKGKRLKVGDRFDLEVADPVRLNGVTVIPAGSRAVGEITAVRNKGMWGKSGNIETRLLYVYANGRQIRLSGRVEHKGKAGGVGATAATIASAPLLPIAGFFVTGTSAVIAPGTPVTGYLDEDMPVVFATGAASSAPMIVPASTSKSPSQPSGG